MLQTMLLTHVLPIISQELELANTSSGIVHTLIICLGRTLTATTTENVCHLLNKVLQVEECKPLSLEVRTYI